MKKQIMTWLLTTIATSLFILSIPGCGAGGGGGSTDNNSTLTALSITPTNPSIAKGTAQQFTATGTYLDNTTKDITAFVNWSSSAPSTATINNAGLTATIATGSTSIVAKDTTSGISGTTTLTVTAAQLVSIEITPINPSVAKGSNKQFTATGVFSDGTTQDLSAQATWSSSNTGVAAINSNGLAASVATGSTTITASSGAISGSTALTVTGAILTSISVTPTNPSIAKGTTKQFTATGTYTDGTTQNLTASVTWSSSDTASATISNAAGANGLATSVAIGTTTITATDAATSISGSTTLTVSAAQLVSLSVTPTNPSIAKGTTKQFTATGTYTDGTTQNLTASVTWSSSDTASATISNAAGANGLATSVAIGTTTITATDAATSISGSTTLTVSAAQLVSLSVTPTNPSIAMGTTQQFTAIGTYTDSSTQTLTTTVTWSSSNTATATISNATGANGLATSVAVGTTTIMATEHARGINGTTMLTVGILMGGAIQGNSLNLSNKVSTIGKINQPYGITTDGTNLFVTDVAKHVIYKVVISTGDIMIFAGSAGSFGSSDGVGLSARFYLPMGITTDGTNLFVSDTNNHTIRKIEISTGIVTTVAGTAGTSGTADGTGSGAHFNHPDGITTDGTTLFIADWYNHAVRKLNIATGTVSTIAGSIGFGGAADGVGSSAKFNWPQGITTTGTDLFVADSSNSTIRKINITTGNVTTIAGLAGSSGSMDGTGSVARFYYPEGITTDGTNLFVADTLNHTIRKVVIATGIVTTIAGSHGTYGLIDGVGSSSMFNMPAGITTNGQSLFLTEYSSNGTIRKIE